MNLCNVVGTRRKHCPQWWFNGNEYHEHNKIESSFVIIHHHHHHHHHHDYYHIITTIIIISIIIIIFASNIRILLVLLHHERHHIVANWIQHLGHLCKAEAHYATRQSAGGRWMVSLWLRENHRLKASGCIGGAGRGHIMHLVCQVALYTNVLE